MRGYATLTTAPASRCLTTPEAAAEDLNVDFDPRLEQLVRQASALCEAFCNRTFARASWLEVFDGFGDTLVLSHCPVVSIESITVSGDPGSVSDWRLRPESGLLSWRRAISFHSAEDDTEVRYTAGWVLPDAADPAACDLPDDIQRACLETVRFLYFSTGGNARDPMVRASSTEGIGQTSWIAPTAGVSNLPGAAADALQPYKLVR